MLREYLKYVLKTEMIKGDFEEHQKESIVGKKRKCRRKNMHMGHPIDS